MIERDKQSVRSLEQPAPAEPESIQAAAGRRRFVKGLGIGLPAILTLPRGAAAIAMTSSTDRCVDKCTEATPTLSPFNPNSSPGGTWLTRLVEVFSYTKGTEVKYYYQDKSTAWRTYPEGLLETPPSPPEWTSTGSALQPALGYFDISGSEPVCKWYGPGNPDGSIALNQSCYHSLNPGVDTPTC